MDAVRHGFNPIFSKRSGNDSIIHYGYTLLIDFAEAALVEQTTNGLRFKPGGNTQFDETKHADGSFVKSNENAVVQLGQSKEL